MSMLLYYFVHSAWNQFKKFLRTWAFVLLIVLFTIGGLAAFAVRWYYQRLSGVENLLPEDFMEFFTASGLSGLNALEQGVGLLILGVLFIQTIGAEKSVARLFLPADVNLLFSSDLSPQAILAFRLTTTLGTPILLSVLLLFQTPFLLRRFSLTPLAALSIPACWCLTLGFSVFL